MRDIRTTSIQNFDNLYKTHRGIKISSKVSPKVGNTVLACNLPYVRKMIRKIDVAHRTRSKNSKNEYCLVYLGEIDSEANYSNLPE